MHRQELQVNVSLVRAMLGQIKVNRDIAEVVVSLVIRMVISIDPIVQSEEDFKSETILSLAKYASIIKYIWLRYYLLAMNDKYLYKLGEIQCFFGFQRPPTSAGQEPCGFDKRWPFMYYIRIFLLESLRFSQRIAYKHCPFHSKLHHRTSI